ncbi:uncharacterized protein MONOS_2262 [Monocercomonoides exilis]|uniref:uncharacterized protein n=1 Tax=Monocercomonoides exilis TaxID=2049356 RepID=UPI00355A90F5|nr:hypothetical protein MONOS_2262 [Monocercomonoides exilis]|eukprot:MONOS_2262.1-p1 / transcript=MONOS_2262.1 / gene=MONOS_2262 / organism=Monocercomonoides_exilis_PA203 / gene_product=unspecified product / transcript_product=unspecified product / location=Mono_scaffold00045:139553-140011(+) / protein_length=153 / sequence_SO=supercontig / SO=protein_coding / is_pseudo=false
MLGEGEENREWDDSFREPDQKIFLRVPFKSSSVALFSELHEASSLLWLLLFLPQLSANRNGAISSVSASSSLSSDSSSSSIKSSSSFSYSLSSSSSSSSFTAVLRLALLFRRRKSLENSAWDEQLSSSSFNALEIDPSDASVMVVSSASHQL